ncbi:MAG: polyphosphate polymerase domain-containing protein [Bacteroidota bacterium]
MINTIKTSLQSFNPISLSQMDEVKLMNRVDTKFAFSLSKLEEVLAILSDKYRVLEIESTRTPFYESLYFDDENFKLYHDHYKGRTNRFKVRFRNYVESNLFFLEIKHKIKGRTDKKRIRVNNIDLELDKEQREFLEKIMKQGVNLNPKLWNSFNRITLVNNELKERLTLDFDLKFKWQDHFIHLNNLVIAELKQEMVRRNSPFFEVMKNKGIRPYRLSKYCMGALELYGINTLKYNKFKEKLRKLKSINQSI